MLTTMPDLADALARHYSRGDLRERIVSILAANGRDQRTVTPADLAPLDQFHLGGLKATRELAELAGIEPGWRVLDVGGGLGGPARWLAAQLRCQVTVVELAREYVDVGGMLSEWLDLAGKVHFRCADIGAMHFDDGIFDAAWLQHSSMNIPDKEGLWSGLRKSVRRGGRLALLEIVAGQGEPAYPTPWAGSAEESFLVTADDLRAGIATHGFRELRWEDVTDASREAIRSVNARPVAPDQTLGLHLLMPPEAIENVRGALEGGQVRVVRGMFERR